MNREFLKELLNTPSVSGHEEHIQRRALDFGKGFAGPSSATPAATPCPW